MVPEYGPLIRNPYELIIAPLETTYKTGAHTSDSFEEGRVSYQRGLSELPWNERLEGGVWPTPQPGTASSTASNKPGVKAGGCIHPEGHMNHKIGAMYHSPFAIPILYMGH